MSNSFQTYRQRSEMRTLLVATVTWLQRTSLRICDTPPRESSVHSVPVLISVILTKRQLPLDSTCDPDDFLASEGYSLRQNKYKRKTELLIAMSKPLPSGCILV